jgi:hypothetical protein
MLVPFNTLPQKSRIWIYQSNRPFIDEELSQIKIIIEPFLGHWQRHGQDLKASYKVIYNQFIVISVDENNEVSGCSIDASMHIMQQIEQQFKVDLTDKLQVAFKNGDNINTVSLTDFKKYIGLNKITSGTVVFNNMVDSIEGLKNNWEVPAKQSWHNRFFK